MRKPLTENDRQALEFLTLGPDVPGPVTSEETLFAHVVFFGLVKRGLVTKGMGYEGPIYSISPAGRAALSQPTPNTEDKGIEE